MSGRSQKQMMRDALITIDTSLGSLIAAQYEGEKSKHFVQVMNEWRALIRRSLGHVVQPFECICPRCGIRHGLKSKPGDF